MIRSSRTPHHRARASAMASRTVTKSAIPITNPNLIKPPPTPPAKEVISPDSSPTSGGGVINHPSSTVAPIAEAPRPTAIKPPENTWSALDMGGLNIKNIPSTSGLFTFKFLLNLYLNHNALTSVPHEISKLRHLELLDLSGNNLSTVPPELGMLTQLKELYLFDNHLTTIPPQFGTLHQLQTLGIEGNPLNTDLKNMVQKEGTQALISFLRDSCPVEHPPPVRVWKDLITPPEREMLAQDPNVETFSVLCYNILCEKYATERLYGYTPSWALAWSYRKELILTELMNYSADFLCLQEVDIAQFEDYFTVHLGKEGYDGVYWPKSRHKTMNETDRRQVDGCATFYKRDKYKLVEKQLVEFSAAAMQRQDFKKTDDMFNRVLGKDHIAVICLFENLQTGTRFVVANAHIHWDPAYSDVKMVQVALLLEEVEKIADHFAKYPPMPPPTPAATTDSSSDPIGTNGNGNGNGNNSEDSEGADESGSSSNSPEHAHQQRQPAPSYRAPPVYSDGTKIPLIVCGDFNSNPESGLYDLLSTGSVPPTHPDFLSHTYGRYTSEGIRHRLGLKSAYNSPGAGDLHSTNYTPSFQGVIDYIWYSTANVGVNSVLGEVDRGYLEKVVGFPNAHFPSDHIVLMSEFRVKPPRDGGVTRAPVVTPVFHNRS
ncbi:Endonuclease/exonuclease/phosphatase [Crassisporium funariophilum]|nr:Endonuclease/exonuclease/phosphatase [Crassisporium funariophilum]